MGALPLLTTACGVLSGLSDLEIVDCTANCDAATPADHQEPPGMVDANDAGAAEDASSPHVDAARVDAQDDKTTAMDRTTDEARSDRNLIADATSDGVDVTVDDVAADVASDARTDPRSDVEPDAAAATASAEAVASQTTCVGGSPGIYDMDGKLWERGDGCDGQSGATDGCLIRGSSFAYPGPCYGPCATHLGIQRAGGFVDTGFRCCGP